VTTLVVLQPSYLPWIGYFDQLRRCDYFVFYDDVQYDKNGWRNRNRVKSAGGPIWLTVPVLTLGRMGQAINEVEISNNVPWARKHVRTLEQAYARAPCRATYLPPLAEVLERPWQRLVDLDIAVIRLMCGWLDVERPMFRASALGIGGGQSERLVALCRHFGADTYLSGNAAQAYLDVGLFEANGVQVEWQNYAHPEYSQLHGAFLPYLSAIDLVMNLGEGGAAVLADGGATASGADAASERS
jgi:hypothetical protein